MNVCRNVASHEVGSCNQISRTDRTITETQMGSGETTRFFRVVSKISLAIFIGGATDNLNRILICTNRTVRTQTIELSFISSGRSHFHVFFSRKRMESNIIYDTDCEVILRLVTLHIFIYGNDP